MPKIRAEGNKFELCENLVVNTKCDGCITVPKGFICDLASIPDILYPLGFSFHHEAIIRASIVHDYLYQIKKHVRKRADEIFLELMLEDGLSKVRAYTYYWAVRVGGRFYW